MTTMEIDKKIEKFIKTHHVLTLATATNEGEPYCCNCFFAYDNESAAFIFTSGKETHHAQMMEQNNRVAASIVLETRTVGKIQGLQITGKVKPAIDGDKMRYIKDFPYAVVADLSLWRLEAEMMKFTDNRLGFGKKLIWQRSE